MNPKPMNILVSPLDWGLGHATRCIPVIRHLIKAGHKVTIAGYGRSLILLQNEFPSLESIELRGFSPSFPSSGNTILHLVLLLPDFIGSILQEHRELRKLIPRYHFDIIISDNRYGLWNKKVRSILITHQVMIKTPSWLWFAEYPIYRITRLMIRCFDKCWIPDYKEPPGLSGDLSHKYPAPGNARFIGPLSRFAQGENMLEKIPGDEKITAIISGPEPQRSIFEDILTKQLASLGQQATIITGKPEAEETMVTNGNLTIQPHLSVREISSEINSSSLVICRSGYSSIMDLQALGAKALFVPTPGQTEQIYLAELHQKSGMALWRSQEALNLKFDIGKAMKSAGFKNSTTKSNISSAVADLKKK
jgi:uncharacterized protein (TIGR00661 family)